ncbi:energy transducer TonB [Rhodothermus profundi]|uniref:Outer membrane transport energization protein TonB n=1 Tax=Rhodothermus profundi TaxID=633813 RepID=A0A1M6P2R9_9BACT|nr:energy transducer TonB [Rhodothermus profundi]SHK02193.1 outer membrane transport energization protein TonB [Rhodothermus profundi]
MTARVQNKWRVSRSRSERTAPVAKEPERLRRRAPYKLPEADLRPYYRLFIMLGLTLALALLIVLFHIPWRPETEVALAVTEQEVVQLEEIVQTRQELPPPPPPRPAVPIAVPDETILEEEQVSFDVSLDINEAITELPPPPPPPEPEKEQPAEEEQEIFVVVEEMPELIGGIERLYELLEYPELARKAGMEGLVVVQFVVEPDGSVSNIQVVRSAGRLLDEAAVRAVRQLRFKPGRQRGRPVRVRYALPIRFRLKEAQS